MVQIFKCHRCKKKTDSRAIIKGQHVCQKCFFIIKNHFPEQKKHWLDKYFDNTITEVIK